MQPRIKHTAANLIRGLLRDREYKGIARSSIATHRTKVKVKLIRTMNPVEGLTPKELAKGLSPLALIPFRHLMLLPPALREIRMA